MESVRASSVHAAAPEAAPAPLFWSTPVSETKYNAMVYALPPAPGPLDYLLFPWRALGAYFNRLSAAFGWRYVAIVVLVYGVNQGLGESFAFFATQYLLTDEQPMGMALSPARYAAVDGFANVPWQLKAIYGVLSDLAPIRGYHRSPYIAVAAIAGTGAFGALAACSGGSLSTTAIALLLFVANFSMASPDVSIDGSMAERSASHPLFAPDLQSLAWGSLSVFSLVGSLVKGPLLAALGTRSLFAASVGTSAVLLAPTLRGWLGERRRPSAPGGGAAAAGCCGPAVRARARATCSDPTKAPILYLAVIVCALSCGIGALSLATPSALGIWWGGCATIALVVLAVYYLERRVSLVLAKASIYVFLSGAIQPSTPVMFYWYRASRANCAPDGEATWRLAPPSAPQSHAAAHGMSAALIDDAHNGYGRPCFSPEFIGWMSVVGYGSFALGTLLYHRRFSRWSYRRIWQMTQVVFVLLNLLDYIWVSRWNVQLGISDEVFVLGEEVLSPVFARLAAMPLFILAARLCPEGIEATLFALTMGLSNFGGKMGSIMGIGLLHALGGVDAPAFVNLRKLVVIRSLTRALPLLLIPFLVPAGSPSDVPAADDGDDGGDGPGDGSLQAAEASPLRPKTASKMVNPSVVVQFPRTPAIGVAEIA